MATCSSLISGTVKGAVKGMWKLSQGACNSSGELCCSWKQNDTRKLYLGIKSGRAEETLEELGEGRGLSIRCGAHVFLAFSAATDAHVITFWPLRCKQPIVWNFQGCLLKGGTQMGALWIFHSIFLL